jgi:hypothetical protein
MDLGHLASIEAAPFASPDFLSAKGFVRRNERRALDPRRPTLVARQDGCSTPPRGLLIPGKAILIPSKSPSPGNQDASWCPEEAFLIPSKGPSPPGQDRSCRSGGGLLLPTKTASPALQEAHGGPCRAGTHRSGRQRARATVSVRWRAEERPSPTGPSDENCLCAYVGPSQGLRGILEKTADFALSKLSPTEIRPWHKRCKRPIP